jgi:hypothetical protein
MSRTSARQATAAAAASFDITPGSTRHSARAALLAAQRPPAAAADQLEILAPVAGDKELRICLKRTGASSAYRDLSERELLAESRSIERQLDLEQRKRAQKDIEAEEIAEAAAMQMEEEEEEEEEDDDVQVIEDDDEAADEEEPPRRRSSRARHASYRNGGEGGGDDDDDEFDPAEAEAADAAEAQLDAAQDEADGDYDDERPRGRERLARSAKTASLERVHEQVRQMAERPAAAAGPSVVDRVCGAVDTLKLMRKAGGFTTQRLRNFLCSDDEGMDSKVFKKAFEKCVELGLLYKVEKKEDATPGHSVPRFKLDRQALHKFHNAREYESRARKEKNKRRNSNGGMPESGDDADDDVVPISRSALRAASSAAAAVAETYLDPALQLLTQLKDAVCPWAAQVRESERLHPTLTNQPSAAGKSKRVSVSLSVQPSRRSSRRNQHGSDDGEAEEMQRGEHKEERNPAVSDSAFMQDVKPELNEESKEAPPPVSSLSTLKSLPVSSLSSLPPPEDSAAGEPEEERKEGPSAPAVKAEAVKAELKVEDEDSDTMMEDVPVAVAAAPVGTAAAPTASDAQVASFLRQRGQSMLSDFLLLSIMRAPHQKITLQAMQDALGTLQHVPPAFVEWAHTPSTAAPAAAAAAADDASAAPVRSPLEACLEQLVSRGMLHAPSSSRDHSYRASSAANDLHRKSEPLLAGTAKKATNGGGGGGEGRGSRKSRAQMEHEAKLRSLRQLMLLRQQGFVEAHKTVLGPFITAPKERARHHLPPTLRSDATDVEHKAVVHDFPMHPVPTCIEQPELVRDYQKKGFSFLADLHDKGAAGILSDEMGFDTQHRGKSAALCRGKKLASSFCDCF